VIGLAICGFVVATIVQEYVRGAMARRSTTGENFLVAVANLWSRNGRRYGGYIVHLGIVMIGVAVIGNEFYQQSLSVTLAKGERATIGRYELVFQGMESNRQANLIEFVGVIDSYSLDSGKQVATLFPKRNIYDKTPDMPTSEVGLHMSPIEDIYVVLNGWDNGGASATFTIYINPLTAWMWVGGIVLVIGTLIAAWPHAPRRRTESVRGLAYAPGDD
jgi:cytochrome c-type biogenesis protein CcmF